jgi:hypothetical protein
VVSALSSLAQSQASQMLVPGGAPSVVSTNLIQMAVSLDRPGTGSRLFSAPLTAPGATASFNPLPPSALAAAGGSPVSSTFLSLGAFTTPPPPRAYRANAKGGRPPLPPPAPLSRQDSTRTAAPTPAPTSVPAA